jgi:hypothetical protein
MRNGIFTFAGCLVLTVALVAAQAPPTPPPAAPPAAPAAAPQPAEPPGPAPQLTSTEALEVENLTLKMQLLNGQFNELLAQINGEHPGWQFHPELNRFVYVTPQPVPAPAAKEPRK